MKKICMSAGLVMVGASVTQAQYAPGLSPIETAKPWSFSATVRGFYDNNYLTLPKTIPGPNGTFVHGARDSFGVETTPSISYNHSTSDTLFSASYVYDLMYYEDRNGTTDQSHQFNAALQHEFSERYKGSVTEQLVIAQEPTVLDTAVITTPLRTAGNNVRNTAGVDFTAGLTRVIDLHLSYGNTLYAFQENAGDEAPANSFPSYSALLDRMDQTWAMDLRWKALPSTTAVLGYQFEHVNYTSPEDIIFSPAGPTGSLAALYGPGHYVASSRDQDSHYFYVGADQTIGPRLNGSLRVGGEYLDYYNAGTTTISPYVDASVTYTYMPQSTAQLGIKHVHNATDVAGILGSTPVLDEESTAVYASVNHHVTSRFTASALGQAQFSTFNGGGPAYNGLEEDFFLFSVNLAYHFSPWLTGETGYTYTKLASALADRGYSRNQVYIGVRATY
jgi:hypothetical protein